MSDGKPECALIGEDGNIFNLVSKAKKTLKRDKQFENAEELQNRVLASESYDEAIQIIMDYVEIV